MKRKVWFKKKSLALVLVLLLLFPGCAKKTAEAQPAMSAPQYNSSNITVTYDEMLAETESGTEFNTEEYNYIADNRFFESINTPLSTFSIDVDTASYSNIRRFISSGEKPPQDAVRIEELINYFTYDYPQPEGNAPFSITREVGECPWNSAHKLVMLGLQGKKLETDVKLNNNLVFLMDVSGSMQDPDKLPLLKSAFKMLVNQLGENDKVSIVVYAGSAGMVLEPTSCNNKDKILAAIEGLEAGGSTAGGEGILLAYKTAQQNFIKGGNNRVILATDGDFNVGVSSEGELTRLIEQKRQEGIFLTVLGFGTGNLKDSKMEMLADKGNGNYAYIDSLFEAKKVLVNEIGSTLYTIAKDVKLQVEFNPAKVKAYRLIGYENRVMNKEDFNDDRKDAGELGAGHSVTAFYEIVPAGSDENTAGVDQLQFQQVSLKDSNDWMNVKLRYKLPEADESQLLVQSITEKDYKAEASGNFRFAAAVAEFGLLLRDSEYKGSASFESVLANAREAMGDDKEGYRIEFIRLVETASALF
ncbi:MAG TPA: VWA domain-containing protein [Clostridia bacterium]|nr:VWA domain-containing protein [Clostridia bacterium]